MVKMRYLSTASHVGSVAGLLLLTGVGLGGCSALPASGPTERDVLTAQADTTNQIGYHIVPITPAIVAALEVMPAPSMTQMAGGRDVPRTDAIGPGDILGISIYEVGSGLFGGGATVAGGTATDGPAPTGSASGSRLPPVQVDGHGDISLPFVGRVHAAGHTSLELAEIIRSGLRRVSQDPQVMATITEAIAASAYVQGDVRAPGRRPLTLNHERVLDLIALSGGTTFPSPDMRVVLTRNSHQVEVPLVQLEQDLTENVVVFPGDRIRLMHRGRSFEVFGASGKVSELPFETSNVTLAEALARAGGPSNDRADPNAIFLFRYEPADYVKRIGLPLAPGSGGTGMQPVVYKLDLMDPTSYFLMQRFAMRDKDLIYIANARSDRFTKAMSVLYNLAFPAALGRQLAN